MLYSRYFMSSAARMGRTTGARFACCLLTTALLLPVAASAHEKHPPAPAELGAGASFDAAGNVWVVSKRPAAEAGKGHLVIQRSQDMGKTWSKPVQVTPVPEPIAARGENHPKIRTGRNGELYVSWSSPMAKRFSGNIRFARSVDGGATFSAPVTVNRDRREIGHNFDVLGVDRDGHVYLAWIDAREREDGRQAGRAYRGSTIYAAVSRDGGATFAVDFKVADHSCECCRLAMTPAAAGGVHLLWRHVFEPNIRDHALTRITSEGKADSVQRATREEWRLDACPHHGPSLTEDEQGQLHAVWFSLGNLPGVKYGRLRGDQLPEGIQVLGDSGITHADIASHGSRIAIVWLQFDGQKTELRSRQSADRGQTWQDAVLAETREVHEQPRLLQHAGRFHAFWNTADKPMQLLPLP